MTNGVDILLESTLASVDIAERLVTEAAKSIGIDEEEQIRLGLAIHECMVNAVVHGNQYSEEKKVHLNVVPRDNAVEVIIGAQGDGFNPDDVPNPLEGDNLLRASGRGVLLIRAFVDEYEVRRLHPHGTEVRLVKYRAES